MDKIDLSNCRQSVAGGGGGDYFAQQLQSLKRAIANRCATVTHTNTMDRYTSLSTSFNAQLAGRFPFAPVAGPVSAGPGLALGAADPSEVRWFFQEFGADLPALQARFQSADANDEAGSAAEVFLTQLIAVQAALMPMLADPAGNTPLSYQVDVAFFTNPETARAQNQVIDATVNTGNQRASSLNGTSRIVWTNGQPLNVRLRWATNAPMVPDASGRQSRPRINGLGADFDFGGNWALLRLIEVQAPGIADVNALQDRQPEVVAFEVPLKFNVNTAKGGNTRVDTAKVFMRLALTGIVQMPGQPLRTVPVTLPPFPTAAPPLGGRVSYLGPPATAAPIQLAIPAMGSALQ
jgi:type VI secretion system protein ImpL